jgi:DNA-binding response OmpR family regulator
LRLFHEHQGEIVCVLLDLVMPGMDGEEILRELRRAGSDVPVLLSSGFSEQDATSRFGGTGLAFLKKPYGPDELLAQVRTLMQGRDGHTDGDTSS